MNILPDPTRGRLLLVLAPHAAAEAMLALTAHLARRGPLRVLDGGNRFNAYRVARFLRPLSGADLSGALERIQVARAFTCYQMLGLLQASPPEGAPTLVIDFLDTFYDQSALLAERRRLLDRCLEELARLSRQATVVVSVRPPRPPQIDPTGLQQVLQAAADQVWFQEEVLPVLPARLF